MTETNEIKAEVYPHWQRRIALFLGSQSLSMFGSSLVQYAIMWHIVLNTESGVMMTLYVLAGFLPQIIISPFAGVLADRFPRKAIIMLSDTVIALVTLMLAFVFMTGYMSYWLLFLVAFIRSLGGGIQAPAVSAVIPSLVPQKHLMRINGINGSLQSFIFILSPAAGGVILTMSTITATFFVDVFTALVGVAIIAFLSIPTHQKALKKERGGYLRDLKEGLIYVHHSGFIKEILVFYTVFCIFLAPAAFLAPIFVTRAFGGAYWMLTATEVGYSVGSIIGGLMIAAWGGFRNRTMTIALGTAIFGATVIFLGLSPALFFFLAVIFLSGISGPLVSSPLMVVLQERIDQDILGRVFSLVSIVGGGAVPLGMVIFGPLADLVDIRLLFYISGLFIVLLSLFIWSNKNLRKAGLPLGETSAAAVGPSDPEVNP